MSKPIPVPEIAPLNTSILNDLETDVLKALWAKHFGRPPPLRSRKSLLVDCLAYRIQEQVFGGLAYGTRAKLKKLANDVTDGKKPAVLFQPKIKPGTRLIRAWGGQTHEVQALDSGFSYRNRRYTNLSEIARVITGSRWSGPLFFGIKRKEMNRATETAHGN